MVRLKLTLQYNGCGLHGWQHQVDGGKILPTVEGYLLDAWHNLTGEDFTAPGYTGDGFQAAGRTDAGVHALAMVVHCDTDWVHAEAPIKVMDGLNHYLPPFIRAVRTAVVEDDFHARFYGVARHYRYVLFNERVMRPDWLGRAGHERQPLDFARLTEALEHLPLGESDFSAFRDAECQSINPVCNLLHRSVVDAGEGFYHFHFSANHFLHHMVRNLIGTLVSCALVANPRKKRFPRPTSDMATILASKDRTKAGITFAADGLYFMGVDYRPHTEAQCAGEGFDFSLK